MTIKPTRARIFQPKNQLERPAKNQPWDSIKTFLNPDAYEGSLGENNNVFGTFLNAKGYKKETG